MTATWRKKLRPTIERVARLARDLCAADDITFSTVDDSDRAGLWVIDNATPLFIADTAGDRSDNAHPDDGRRTGMRSWLGVPVATAKDGVLGAFCIGWRRTATDADVLTARLVDLAGFISTEYERLRGLARAQAALRGATTLVASVPLSLMMTDMDVRLLEATPRWLADFGVGRSEAVGKILYDFNAAHFEKFRPMFDRCLAGETVKVGRLRLPDIDGVYHWLQAELNPWRDESGNVAGMIGAATDITDTVEALEKSERSEQRLELAMKLAAFRVWEIDHSRGQLNADAESARRMDGADGATVNYGELRKDLFVAIHPDDRERVHAEWAQAKAEKRPFRTEYRYPSEEKEIWLESASEEVRGEDGRIERVVGIYRDITERKGAERELIEAKDAADAANVAKVVFLATMSHEIRTPLNGVLGMAQAMAADELSTIQRERVKVIQQSGAGLLTILNDVLDMAKIEAGRLDLEAIDFDIGAVLEGARSTFMTLTSNKGLDFKVHCAPEADVCYRGDPTRLRQILYNLISNALKFTEQGEVRLSVEREGDILVIKVADTGIGMSASDLTQLFNRFVQADASTTRRFGGTGLGLAICRELSGLMGGSLDAESELGLGTTFTVRLPMLRVGDAMHAPPDAAKAIGLSAQEQPLRVLAAEDNEVNRLVLKTLLGQVGIEPVLVENGQLALEAWRREPWDIILMDVQMPVMDGLAATQAIRAEEAALGRGRTPIIALTANAMAHQVAEYRARGMDGHVAKPIEVVRLYEALQAVIDTCADPGDSVDVGTIQRADEPLTRLA